MQKNKKKIHDELYLNIIPFWEKLKDNTHGGFLGWVNNNGTKDIFANKGSMLQMRILWFYSKLYHFDSNPKYKNSARHSFDFFKTYILNNDGGINYELDYKGMVVDDTKHLYYQSFALYSISQYYESFIEEDAKIMSHKVYKFIEENFKDETGYIEQLNDSENKIADLGIKADRTMNALLHLLEAYTYYYKVFKNEEAKTSIKKILDLFLNKIYNTKLKRLEVMFDHSMNTLADYHSYGHDIEASWLLDYAAKIINEKEYIEKINIISNELCETVYKEAFLKEYIKTETVNGKESSDKVWWVHAEAVVGFYRKGKELKYEPYMKASEKVLGFIFNNFINEEAGEWYWQLDDNNKPNLSMPLVSNWKCPYHNGRMCIMMLKELV